MSGLKFGKLSPLECFPKQQGKKLVLYWRCLCDCGEYYEIRRDNILKSKNASCLKCKTRECYIKDDKLKNDRNNFSKYKENAKYRNKSFNLTFPEFQSIILSNCHYCGSLPLSGKMKRHNGIDRKDNSLGYEKSNCLPCCKDCNYLKGAKGYDEFINLIVMIFKNMKTQYE